MLNVYSNVFCYYLKWKGFTIQFNYIVNSSNTIDKNILKWRIERVFSFFDRVILSLWMKTKDHLNGMFQRPNTEKPNELMEPLGFFL